MRQGLTKRAIVDKNGRRTHVWVKLIKPSTSSSEAYHKFKDINIKGNSYRLAQVYENGNYNNFIIEDGDGAEIGRATLSDTGNFLTNIRIDDKHRRIGLASHMYNYIESVTGKSLKPSPVKQSPEAKALWDKRKKNRGADASKGKIGGDPKEAFMDDFWAMSQGNPFGGRDRIFGGTMTELSIFDGHIHISSINSFDKGTGQGSIALKRLTHLADKHGVSMTLTARPYGDGGGLKAKHLKSWYKRHGFREREGFEGDEDMIRMPVKEVDGNLKG